MLNKVILIGNLGHDPEVRNTTSGDAITTISLATTMRWKDKAGAKQEKTEWHRVTFFSKLAEIASEYLRKGSQVYIEGRLETRKFEKHGETKYSTEIIANEMIMLGSRQESASPKQAPAANKAQFKKSRPESEIEQDDFGDDVPF